MHFLHLWLTLDGRTLKAALPKLNYPPFHQSIIYPFIYTTYLSSFWRKLESFPAHLWKEVGYTLGRLLVHHMANTEMNNLHLFHMYRGSIRNFTKWTVTRFRNHDPIHNPMCSNPCFKLAISKCTIFTNHWDGRMARGCQAEGVSSSLTSLGILWGLWWL